MVDVEGTAGFRAHDVVVKLAIGRTAGAAAAATAADSGVDKGK